MTLHINNADFAKERSESNPLSLDEQNESVGIMNMLIKHNKLGFRNSDYEKIQNLLFHYENLQAISDMVKGWDGVTNLLKKADAYDELIKQDEWVSVDKALPARGVRVICTDGILTYEASLRLRDGVWHGWHALNDENMGDVTHWRPLPQPPKNTTKDTKI